VGNAAAPEVSVVLPAYNGERFIAAAVRSVLGQTFRNFELIVVDDGSVDATPEMLANLQRGDDRVSIHRHPQNLGLRAALNTGCRLARAPLVAKMSHDDVCLPDRFERQVSFLHDNPSVGVVGSSVQIIDDQDRRGQTRHYPTSPALVAWSMLFANAIAHPAVMMRRELLDPSEAYPDGCLGGTEDYALFGQLSRRSRVANLDEVLLLYRSWGGNMTHTRWAQQEHGAAGLAAGLADSWGVSLSADDATVLRGLSRAPYPRDPRQLRSAARAVIQWTEALLADERWEASDRQCIRREAAIKLLLISSLVSWRAPHLALSASTSAMRLSPTSPVPFAIKVVQEIGARLGMSQPSRT
jgi:glycosyltransferase involved in cell wall biosynthesis